MDRDDRDTLVMLLIMILVWLFMTAVVIGGIALAVKWVIS